jgi:hypothetical protein
MAALLTALYAMPAAAQTKGGKLAGRWELVMAGGPQPSRVMVIVSDPYGGFTIGDTAHDGHIRASSVELYRGRLMYDRYVKTSGSPTDLLVQWCAFTVDPRDHNSATERCGKSEWRTAQEDAREAYFQNMERAGIIQYLETPPSDDTSNGDTITLYQRQ